MKFYGDVSLAWTGLKKIQIFVPLTLCLSFSLELNSKGTSSPGMTSFHSDIFPDTTCPELACPARVNPELVMITFEGVEVTIAKNRVHPGISQK